MFCFGTPCLRFGVRVGFDLLDSVLPGANSDAGSGLQAVAFRA